MSVRDLLLVGAGGHARSCIDVIECTGQFRIVGLVGLREQVGAHLLGYPVLVADDDLDTLAREVGAAVVTVGQIKTADIRAVLFRKLEASGCALPVIVSPTGHVSKHAKIGAGSVVLHGAVVNAGASIGKNCIVNTHALVEHDSVIGDHCHISTHTAINSGVRIGDRTFVGSCASVRQGIVIGTECVIGMAQVVLRDCPDGTQLSTSRPI
jgi:sugar O-acyltransferase (sialic acid O-acetyltransferase NeuD family)